MIALAIVLGHYGAWVPLPQLRRRCDVSEHGVTALSLVQTGKLYGLAIRAMRLSADDLRHIQAPVILFWEQWHFLVLEGIRGDTAWVNDPARGHRKLSMAALRKGYSGVALIAQPGPRFTPSGSPRRPFRTIVDTLRPRRWQLILMGGAVLAESVLLALTITLIGGTVGADVGGRMGDWLFVPLALTSLLAAYALRLRLTDAAVGTSTRLSARQVLHALALAPANAIQRRQSDAIAGQRQLAAYPAATAARIGTAGIRILVAVPLLVLILARIHLFAGIVALAVLAATFLFQQLAGRAPGGPQRRTGSVPPANQGSGTWHQPIAKRWGMLRIGVELAPVIAVGLLATPGTNALPNMLVALLATWFAFRLLDSAIASFSMLYSLPESIIQLMDTAQERDVAGHIA